MPPGAPAYRARQLYRAIHAGCVWEWQEASELSLDLKAKLAAVLPLRSLCVDRDLTSAYDGTRKVLFRTVEGGHVESVLMHSDAKSSRHTVCVSSQIGCPAACAFCASGLSFTRNLTTAEIIDQVEFFAGALRRAGRRLDNLVYMGMGEPFLNYQRVMESISQVRDPEGVGLGARRITVSTVGIVPAIQRFATEAGEVNLAVSLHAPNDDLRSELVPYNHRFPIAEVMTAVEEYIKITRRRVSFEYVLLQGTNDSSLLARELAMLLIPLNPLVHVNLIPWNPFGEALFARATRETAEAFARKLRGLGINATIRYSKGLDIDAACGQLRERVTREAMAS
jgi:23S rRNA (adenine2503-C2)-methyltransferase